MIGGGSIAARKVAQLVDLGAQVTVVSPALDPAIARLVDCGAVDYRARRWERGDLAGYALAFAATNDPQAHREIFAEAQERGILLNVADEPRHCDFISPAIVKRGDLQIAISTSGASPASAARIRRDLEERFGWEYAAALKVMRAAREYLKARGSSARGARLRALAASDLAALIRAGDAAAVDDLLRRHTGASLKVLELESQSWIRDTKRSLAGGGN